MLDPEYVRRGFKRLALVLVAVIAAAVALYALGDSLLVSQRKHLFTVEIIFYVLSANLISICIFYIGFHVARWVVRGFKVGGAGQAWRWCLRSTEVRFESRPGPTKP